MWYAAHIFVAYENDDKSIHAGSIILEENIVLISAEDRADATLKAKEILNNYTNKDGIYHFPKNSIIIKSGIKKIIDVSNPDLENDSVPNHGSEISYNVLEFRSEQRLDQFLSDDWFEARAWEAEAEQEGS